MRSWPSRPGPARPRRRRVEVDIFSYYRKSAARASGESVGEPANQEQDQQRVAPTFVLKYNIRAVRALGSARRDLAGLDKVIEG